MKTPCYIQREEEVVLDLKKKLKKAGLHMMSTKEACAKDIHPMRDLNVDGTETCSFCHKEIDTSKDCCY